MSDKTRVPQWIKVIGLIGGGVGAVAATIATGGSALVAVLVGIGAVTSGASALYMPAPEPKAKMRKGQLVDKEDPR
jgi:hypothetical protein